VTEPHATDSLLPIIRRMHDAETDRERAAVLLEVPDRILAKYRPVFEQACVRARFDLGLEYIAIRKAEWCATRGPDGRHKSSIFEDARKNFAAFAKGESGGAG